MFPFLKVIIICWIIFWIYWFIAAFNTKHSHLGRNLRQFMGIRIVIFVVAVVLFRFFNVHNSSSIYKLTNHKEWVLIIGFIIFLIGLALAIWARINLAKNWGMPMTQKQNPELVTSGPYAYIRHPIYSGILLAILGCVVVINLFWLIIFALAGVYFIYSSVIEEKLLMKQLPNVYPKYKSKTKMLVPFLF